MKRSTAILCLLLLLSHSPFALAAHAQTPPKDAPRKAENRKDASLEGNWEGTLDVGAATLRLLLKLSATPDGGLKGTLDSLDQGASDLPIDVITYKEGALHFEMKAIGAAYDGKVEGDGPEITGTWKQSGQSWPLVFKRQKR